MKSFNRSPIIHQFRLAAKSCNEWRDTLFYTGLVAVGVASHHWDLGVPPHALVKAAGSREICRMFAWNSFVVKEKAHLPSCAAAALSLVSLFLLGDVVRGVEVDDVTLFLTANPVRTVLGMAATTYSYRASGGIRSAYQLYKDKLFDYPRKIKPPSKPHKKPSLEKFREAWNGIKDRLGTPVPQGAFAPIRIGARHSHALGS